VGRQAFSNAERLAALLDLAPGARALGAFRPPSLFGDAD
jgi:hypothetical protein